MKKPLEVINEINSLGLMDDSSRGRFKVHSRTTWNAEYCNDQGKVIDKLELPYETDNEIKAFSTGLLWRERIQEYINQERH